MKLLAIDGNSIINRAFYGIRPLSTKDGRVVNGVYGFLNILLKLIDDEKPDGVAVAFDLKAPTFRHKEYAEYKAGRKPMPEDLRPQLPMLKGILPLFGCVCLEKEGYEADDILGTLARIMSGNGNVCRIATGDRDALQLVDERTQVILASTKAGRPETEVFDIPAVAAKYGGLTPPELIELKALMGDSSDNIPGVAGVGEKTAVDLISRFHSIDNIYADPDSLDIRDSVREKLKAGRDSAFLSRRLGTIFREVPIDNDPNAYRFSPRDDNALATALTDLEFFKMLERLGLKAQTAAGAETDTKSAEKVFRSASVGEIKSLAMGGAALFISTSENDLRLGLCCGDAVSSVDRGSFVGSAEALELLTDGRIRKCTDDTKRLCRWCIENGAGAENIFFDSALAGYVLNPSASGYDTERLAAEYADTSVKAPDGLSPEEIHAALLSVTAPALASAIEANGQSALLSRIEIPLAKVLAEMEHNGFLVDVEGLKARGNELQARIDELSAEIFRLVGWEFNLNSPKQLGEALFERLGLPGRKKTKTGYSTGAEVLEELRDAHPAISLLLQYRALQKLKSTYCDGLSAAASSEGRIHSTLNQTETRTGRISSSEPNLQNIPVRTEEGRELRKYFIARPGFCLIDADYSQIELRVLAHMADDKTMIDAFRNNADIHTITASQVFGLPAEMVTPIMRSRAKAVNFGIVYGIGAFSLSKDIGVSVREAAKYIDGYLGTYTGVREYMENVVESAKRDGYVTTMFGRRRMLPELKSPNANLRAFGERVARNMPIQGSAADIIKIAMVHVSRRLKEENLNANIILQVHDELIVEASDDCAERAAEILKYEMEHAADLTVPLTVDIHTGKTWYEAKG